MEATTNVDQLFNERVRFFQEFLDEDYGYNQYKIKLQKMYQQERVRLVVNLDHLRAYNREYAQGILNSPIDYVPAFDKALKDVVQATLAPAPTDTPYHVGFEGNFGAFKVSPRHLSSSHLGKMICVEGSLVRPKVAKSVHYCEKTGLFHAREYRDGYSLANQLPTGSVYPKEDENGNPLTTEFGYSVYRDYQMIYIQEMPERSPAGELPRPIDVLLDDDLVDKVKPGDRISLVGAYRSIGKGNSGSISSTFRTVFIANNVEVLNKEINAPVLTDDDAREIRNIAKRKDAFSLVSTSLAPSLFGHEYIKKALLLLMLGEGIFIDNESDINILLIGDPSVGKSQMLRFVLNLAPLAIATTGRGSSGVGLTAAVTQDKETGERTLEAGAMVLADRGVVCIDEFDKMSDIDRVAIHEVMEQQTVTIAKAGIHTSLNARCSVLAAANPAFGSYLDEKKPFENITLPDSLLSRFDLVFVVLDKTDNEFNRAISEHITRLHRYIPPGVEEGTPMTEALVQTLKTNNDHEQEEEATPVFQKYNELLHIGFRPATITRRRKSVPTNDVEILSIPFLKKYLFYAKNRIKPVLTQEACDFISNRYAELRSKVDGKDEQYRTMPITPRTLETLIRLSTAHAKVRLSKLVETIDAEVAFEILVFALFKEVKQKKREKRPKTTQGSDDESDDETVVTVAPSLLSRPSTAHKSGVTGATSSRVSQLLDDMIIDDDSSVATTSRTTPAQSSSQQPLPLTGNRFDTFKAQLFNVKSTTPADESVTLDQLVDGMNSGVPQFSKAEILATIKQMSENNIGVWYQEETEALLFI